MKMNALIRPVRKDRDTKAVININGQLMTLRQRDEASNFLNFSNRVDSVEDTMRRDLSIPNRLCVEIFSVTGSQSSSPEPFPYSLRV